MGAGGRNGIDVIPAEGAKLQCAFTQGVRSGGPRRADQEIELMILLIHACCAARAKLSVQRSTHVSSNTMAPEFKRLRYW